MKSASGGKAGVNDETEAEDDNLDRALLQALA